MPEGQTVDPIVEVSCCNERKFTSAQDDINGISTVTWNEHLFFEPKNLPENLLKPLGDYDEGSPATAGSRQYPVDLEFGTILISDSYLMHQTVKGGSGVRLSIDFRSIAGDLLAGEDESCDRSRAVYVDTAVWLAAGSTVILGNDQPIDAFQRRQRGETVTPRPLSLKLIEYDG